MDMFVLTSAEHPPPPRRHPGPHLQLQISRASTPFKQIGVTGCSCQCHHLPKWDHVSSLPPNLTWEAVVWECCRETLSDSKASAETVACVQGRPGFDRRDEPLQTCVSHVENQRKQRWPKGLRVFSILTSSWWREHELNPAHQNTGDS